MARSHLAILVLLLLASIQVVLALSQDTKYIIISSQKSEPPPRPLGINRDGPIAPVIVDGKDKLWTFERLENGYFTISSEGLFLSHKNGYIVVDSSSSDQWEVRKFGGALTIELVTNRYPPIAVTLLSNEPGTVAELEGYDREPLPEMLWNIVPYNGYGMRPRGRSSCGQHPLAY